MSIASIKCPTVFESRPPHGFRTRTRPRPKPRTRPSSRRRMRNLRRAGPAPWKPLVAISGPSVLPVEFDAA
jgi:hypothetical protein